MFQTFTGSSKRPRQVNLSGRNQNPFLKHGPSQGPSSTVVHAQQTRFEREQDRIRAQAAINLQKTWRGRQARQQVKEKLRKDWDNLEAESSLLHTSQYRSGQTVFRQLALILQFIDIRDARDQDRLRTIFTSLSKGYTSDSNTYVGGPWPMVYLRLQNTCLNGLENGEGDAALLFQEIIEFTAQVIPELTTKNAQRCYDAIRHAMLIVGTKLPASIIAAPLQHLGASTELAYHWLAIKILTIPNILESNQYSPADAQNIEKLAEVSNCKLLTSSLSNLLESTGSVPIILNKQKSRLETRARGDPDPVQSCAWLVSYLVFLNRQALGHDHPERFASSPSFVHVICTLLAFVADNLPQIQTSFELENESVGLLARRGFHQFILDQVESLVDQRSILSLLSRMNAEASDDTRSMQLSVEHASSTKALATYILTLLRLYPNRGDDIRLWLYLGSGSASEGSGSSEGPTAVKFFWQTSLETSIFRDIHADARAAINLLRPQINVAPSELSRGGRSFNAHSAFVDHEWQTILLFIEMYSFVLKVMDDEEFFSHEDHAVGLPSSSEKVGRKNSLSLDDIRTLSIFLKHLGFTMYYNAAEIAATAENEPTNDMRNLFKKSSTREAESDARKVDKGHQQISVSGVDLDYLKGAVTGLIRAIYERDSRRRFMPDGFWLMNLRFDMRSFIDAVVEEEERRHQVQEADDEDDGDDSDDQGDTMADAGLVGNRHAQQLRKLENQRRQQRKESRKRYLQAVAPRLEILQNMPFLIPFTTRVQIFRRFIHLDQMKRRNGAIDPETWRLTQMHAHPSNSWNRHYARVRRGHEFEDAFEQFYSLGASLKEPIHITFLDQFDQEEAGIDGGGVTKEFLTSVTAQAFSERQGVRLFVENDKHILFPNPTALEEQAEILKEAGFRKDSAEFRHQMADVLRQYEFLGRIIGKCLYEGILVDIGFAGFFLLKWALTGGSGSAPKESGYRANINDLRDFDQELYEGLLKLKNYRGDVDAFSLNFSVADTFSIPSRGGKERKTVIDRELRPGGNNIPVTNANRLVYISYMARHRLSNQPSRQTNAFLEGLRAMISPSWLSMFNQQELQTLVGGAASAINVQDLRANTSYGGVYTIGDDGLEHESVQLFWQVMENLEDEDRRKVLKFVTSTPRAPLLGFASLTPRFSIRDSGGDSTRLPSTSTCVNLLKLPRYQDFKTCRTKLLQAVNAGAGFDLS